MSEFSKKLINDYIAPSKNKDRIGTLIATVINANPKRKKYDIELIDENGDKKIIQNIRVKNNGDASGDYSPEANDQVMVEVENNVYTIIGKSGMDEYEESSNNKLRSDIYTNLIYDIIPGNIY